MTILFTALALAAAPAPASVQPAPPASHATHAQHAAPGAQSPGGAKPQGAGCACCKDMGAGKMDCCAKHGEHGAKPSGHSANH